MGRIKIATPHLGTATLDHLTLAMEGTEEVDMDMDDVECMEVE